ncbi:unnamed protein product [Alopecurus aequalis]
MPAPPDVPEEAAEETLLEEILEQIFLRLPPDEPACLLRASLTSKRWLALLSGPQFRSRYREHHGTLPMLGFLSSTPWYSPKEGGGPAAPPFFSTTGFRAHGPGDGTAWDCRHGRVLLCDNNSFVEGNGCLAVWDPMTGRRCELPEPEAVYGQGSYAAAVLCAVSGCDHLACHEGPFRVVYFYQHRVAGDDFVAQACVSSTDFHRVAEWSDPCPEISVGGHGFVGPRPPLLLNDALHLLLGHASFGGVHYAEILKYNLTSNSLSLIDAPKAGVDMAKNTVLMALEDGNLGFAHLKRFALYIWSRHMGSDGVAAWTQRRVINLRNLLPIQNPTQDITRLLGSVEGSDVIFVTTDLGIYKIDLKSLQQKKISDIQNLVSLIPYLNFYLP